MTGEITLRGEVLRNWWIERKTTCCYQIRGIREVIIPKDNEKDLRDLPKI